jgi:hypothetical protein
MKRNNQNAGIRNGNTSVRKSYLFVALMTLLGFGILSTVQATQDQGGVPVFKFSPEDSVVNFNVSASVPITGKFEKWDASLTFTPESSRPVCWRSKSMPAV